MTVWQKINKTAYFASSVQLSNSFHRFLNSWSQKVSWKQKLCLVWFAGKISQCVTSRSHTNCKQILTQKACKPRLPSVQKVSRAKTRPTLPFATAMGAACEIRTVGTYGTRFSICVSKFSQMTHFIRCSEILSIFTTTFYLE